MKKQVLTFVLLLMSVTLFAQSKKENAVTSHKKTTVTTITEKTTENPWYVGLSGGYLFKNNETHNSPMWYLGSGKFVELNAGLRGKLFGWSVALGYLTIDRDKGQFDKLWLNSRMMYDSTTGSKPTSVISGLDKNPVFFTPDKSESEPFKGFYFMTGPNVWFGQGNLKFNLALEAGIGYSQVGYYYMSGIAKGSNTIPVAVKGSTGTPSNYTVSIFDTQFFQYGMSQKYYDKVSTSSLSNPLDEKQPHEIHFMARLTGNVEYFITPRLSVHAGANFWYISSPKMTGKQQVLGYAFYKSSDPLLPDYQSKFKYSQSYKQKDLMNISANIGLKYWFGHSGKTKRVETTEETTTTLQDIKENKKAKTVLVTVVDKLTKTPMGDVKVTLKGLNGQQDIVATTQANGLVKLENVAPGNYQINGEILNIATSKSHIDMVDFAQESPIIRTTLYYSDPRFILKGVAVNVDDAQVVSDVKVNLDKNNVNMANTYSDEDGNFKFLLQSNSNYQVQGLKNGLFSNIAKASTKGLNRSQTLYVKLQLGLNTVEVGRTFQLEDIHYDFDKSNIRPDAARILDRVVNFLEANPNVRIELSSHTDSRGSDAYNMKLSQRRAQSAVDYLVSQGISRSRLVAKGYGETRLLNNCDDGVPCTEAQHQANRRTEITIIE